MSMCHQANRVVPWSSVRLRALPTLALILALSPALAGCPGGGGGSEVDAAVDAPQYLGTVEIGQGTVEWQPLAQDEDLILWSGPQGGHHFIVHVRVQDIEPGDWERPSLPGNPLTEFRAYDESGRRVDLLIPPYALGYRDAELGDGWLYFPSGRFLRTDEVYVPDLFDNRVRIEVVVKDANDVWARDERWIRAIREPDVEADAGPVPDSGP